MAQVVDVDGAPGDPFVVSDMLDRLAYNGLITPDGLAAAREFQMQFSLACFDRLAASDVSRPMVSGKKPADESLAQRSAKRFVREKLDKLGGEESLHASCAWYVIGMHLTLPDWARRQRWSGRDVSEARAPVVLVETIVKLEKLAE